MASLENNSKRTYKTLENLQNIESSVVKIFSKYREINAFKHEDSKAPVIAIVVGAPGVGKTTKSRQILTKMKYNYDNFFNISLDAIVEKIEPYRESTLSAYYDLLAKKEQVFSDLNNDERYKFQNFNAALLSEYYLPTVMSKKSNFTLNNTRKNIKEKIERYRDAKLLEELKKEKAAERALSRKKKTNNSHNSLKSLIELRLAALDFAVKNELNILYDTTLRPKTNIIDRDIMPVLEKYAKDVKYKIIIILVTANKTNIEERIRKRHLEMLKEENPYLRAINPMLTKMFISQNKEGFDEARQFFKSGEYQKINPDTIYKSRDFIFIEKENPPNNAKNITRKNKSSNKAFSEIRTLFGNNNF